MLGTLLREELEEKIQIRAWFLSQRSSLGRMNPCQDELILFCCPTLKYKTLLSCYPRMVKFLFFRVKAEGIIKALFPNGFTIIVQKTQICLPINKKGLVLNSNHTDNIAVPN